MNLKTFSLETDGFVLNYTIEGSGTPVIVIGSHIYYPRTFSKELRKHLQLIFIDHRGFVANSQAHNDSSFELPKLLQDIDAIRQQLGLKQIIILGHSIHAFMALEYAKMYPEAVSKIILIAASPISDSALHEAADRYFLESVCPERKTLLTKNLQMLGQKIQLEPDNAFILRLLAFGPMIWYDAHYDARTLWRGVTINSQGAAFIWGSIFSEYDIKKNLDRITCPVFLALGRYDYFNPPYLWEAVRNNFKNLMIRVFEKSGHTPQLEEARHFDHELQEWLKLIG